MPTFGATSTPTVVIVGDSTSTISANQVSRPELLYSILMRRLREDNPTKTITFYNRSIGGCTWATLASTSTSPPGGGVAAPIWTWTASTTWLNQIAALTPDLVIVNFGINDTYGLAPVDVVTCLTAFKNFSKKPDILIIANKQPILANPDPLKNAGCLNAAGFLRTMCLSNGTNLGISGLPPLGLIDMGRQFNAIGRGFDPGDQLLQRTINVAQGGSPITGITTFPYTFPQCNGDFYLNVTFPAQATTLFGSGVFGTIALDANSWGLFQFKWASGNVWHIVYSLQNGGSGTADVGRIGAAQTIGSGDVQVEITLKREHLFVECNGVNTSPVYDGPITRFAGPFSPVLTFSALTQSPNMTINEYAPGICHPYTPAATDVQLFGSVADGSEGGNASNHMTSYGVSAVDMAVLESTRFAP